MTQSILDTNVLVRFLVGDNTKQQAQAVTWFKEATAGTRKISVHPMVIAETVFVLESFYKHSRETIATSLLPFVAMPVLHVEHRDALVRLWDDFIDGLHFVDAYLLALARQQGSEILSFDKQLLKRVK